MTLSSRNRTLDALVVIAGISAGILGVVTALLVHLGAPEKDFAVDSADWFWFLSRAGGGRGFGELLFPVVLILVVGLFSLVYFRRVFRKTTIPEAWFLAFFSFFLVLDGFRIFQLLILQTGESYILGAFLTRGVLFFRFAALASLFLASLYALDLPYQRVGTMIWGALGVAGVLSTVLPLDTQRLDANLLYSFGDVRSVSWLVMGVLALVLLNYFLGGVKRGLGDAWILPLGALVVLGSWQFTWYSSLWAPLVLGLGLFSLGKKFQEWHWMR